MMPVAIQMHKGKKESEDQLLILPGITNVQIKIAPNHMGTSHS
jgi:hypothetical protein